MLAYNSLRQLHRRFSQEYYGIVVEVDNKSAKCRVRVLGVLEGLDNQLPWAQVKSGFSSGTSGTVNTPRVGSKVFVTFPTGDANHPVITPGWNGKPSQFDSPGTQHGWQDDAGNYLKVDESARTFTLHLSTGAEIKVDSNNNMTIKATDINIEASKDLCMEADGNVKIKGTNISVEASQNIATDASAIETNAVVSHVITGGVVAIN